MAKDSTNLCAPRSLEKAVKNLFQLAAKEERFSKWRSADKDGPPWSQIARFFEITQARHSHWNLGHGQRDNEEIETTERYLRIVRGDFHDIKPTNLSLVTQVHAFWIERLGEKAMNELADSLIKHRQHLERDVGERNHLRDRQLIEDAANDANCRNGGSRSLPAHEEADSAKAAAAAATLWSGAWTSEEIHGWAANLVGRVDRGLYVYGACGSGKSVLVKALCDEIRLEHPDAPHISLNLKALLRNFAKSRDERDFLQLIVNEVARQISPTAPYIKLPEYPDFKGHMVRALSHAPQGPIYLVINHSDAAARQSDPEFRRLCLEATYHLYAYLGDAMEEQISAPSSQLFVILEGCRHPDELQRLYPLSPSPFRAPMRILHRMTWERCARLGNLAGIEDESDQRRLYDETGGHRSLLWPILAEVMRAPGRLLPQDLGALGPLRDRLDELERDLAQQSGMAEAFRLACAGEAIGSEPRQRLIDTMYLADRVPPVCGCPLLETGILGNAPVAASAGPGA